MIYNYFFINLILLFTFTLFLLNYVDKIHLRERFRTYGSKITSFILSYLYKNYDIIIINKYTKYLTRIIRPLNVILESITGFFEGIENKESLFILAENIQDNDNVLSDKMEYIIINYIYDKVSNVNDINNNLTSNNLTSNNSINDNSINDDSINDNSINDNSINDNSINDNSMSDDSINDDSVNDELIETFDISSNNNSNNKNKKDIVLEDESIFGGGIKRNKVVRKIKLARRRR